MNAQNLAAEKRKQTEGNGKKPYLAYQVPPSQQTAGQGQTPRSQQNGEQVSQKALGNLSPDPTPNMKRDKEEWELRKPQPPINPQFEGHLKAYGHTVPKEPVKPQDPYKEARKLGAKLRNDGLQDPQKPFASVKPSEEIRKAGKSLQRSGVKSPHYDLSDWTKTADNINQHLNKNNQGWNVATHIEQTQKSQRADRQRQTQPQPEQKQARIKR